MSDIAPMNRALPAEAACERAGFHPLEIFPFFRRFPASLGRDLLYTLIWNLLFGLAFFFVGALFAARVPGVRVLAATLLVANLVGYSIHLLFWAGSRAGLEEAAARRGHVARVAYYAAVPLVGVAIGYWLASFVLEITVQGFVRHSGPLVTMLAVGLVISVVLSVIFFWRERTAVAEAQLARERERTQRIERASAAAQLRALQAQIEPHFLFNTLANVESLIDPDPARARRMLESFNRFLRASLNATRGDATTLADDARLIASYLDVLQVRMGERLRYRVDIPAELEPFPLPPLLLQPIVENAIRHGLEPKVEGGEVRLCARREAGAVAIQIADTGVGFGDTTRGGVGLANLRERLRLLHGDRASLRIAGNAPSGTVVTLRLPA